jgi:hypothetical protein
LGDQGELMLTGAPPAAGKPGRERIGKDYPGRFGLLSLYALRGPPPARLFGYARHALRLPSLPPMVMLHGSRFSGPLAKGFRLMDRNTIFGGNPLGVLIRLALISLAVGIVMKALGIDLGNFFQRINELLRNIYDLGFGAVEWVLEYMLLGALVVIPIWLIARVVGASRSKTE